jgi:excisionase family DNA binding protein
VLNGKRVGRTFAMVVVKEGSPKLLLTAVEAAEQLTVSRTKVYELMAAGTLRSIRIGRLRRVPVDALKDFIDRSVDQ